MYLDDFADTEDEVELDEEAAEREMRREERRKVSLTSDPQLLKSATLPDS